MKDREEEDSVLEQFLSFMERDIASHPTRVQALEGALLNRIETFVWHIDVDLDAPLSADNE